ncbi:MAG: hypothetical protein ACRC0V_00735 [Fusobacteriaceae bacterium]
MSGSGLRSDGVQPKGELTPSNDQIQWTIGQGHPWGTKQTLQRLRGENLPVPSEYNPTYLATYGTSNASDFLGYSYIQNSSDQASIQESINQYMQTGGIGQIEDMIENALANQLGIPKKKVDNLKRRRKDGVYDNGIGNGSPMNSEPLSQTQLSGPKSTTYESISSQMQMSNPMDENMVQGGRNAQRQNIPPNFIQRDKWNGNMVRGNGYSVPSYNQGTNRVELRHETDYGGIMKNTSTPFKPHDY